MPIEFAEYDPSWPDRAARAGAELQTSVPGAFVTVEHIGSTSVPGLAAKPIIDLMAEADSLDLVTSHDADLAQLGYQRHDTGMPGRLFYYRDDGGSRTHHLHVVPAGTLSERNEVLLRDWLRAHPADMARYAALKRSLVAAGHSGDEYTRTKTDLIQELTDKARAERGLASVPVWEE